MVSLIRGSWSRSRSTSQTVPPRSGTGDYLELGKPAKSGMKAEENPVWGGKEFESNTTSTEQVGRVLPRAPLEGFNV